MKTTTYSLRTMLLACAMTFAATMLAQTTPRAQEAYLFGLSASFNDSTVYITDIQKVGPVYFAPKTQFLYNRNGFSSQLKAYLKELGAAHPTCITFYAQSKKRIEKKYEKIKRKYDASLSKTKKSKKKKKRSGQDKPYYEVHYLTAEQFAYQSIAYDESTVVVDSRKAEAAARKSMRKEQKAQARQQRQQKTAKKS